MLLPDSLAAVIGGSPERGRAPGGGFGGPLPVAGLVLLAGSLLTACGGAAERAETERQAMLAEVDSVLLELGGPGVADLSRSQRWRAIGSVWVGLPPANFEAADLPSPDARGAALLQLYCVQCHWLPAPQMHSADEWPLLLRRMVLRAEILAERMGGPVTARLLGDSLLVRGMSEALVPPQEEQDSILAYLERNALPVAEAGALPQAPGRAAFVERCTTCHETPSPAAHTPAEWEEVLTRMQGNMARMGVEPLSGEVHQEILGYLKQVAGD